MEFMLGQQATHRVECPLSLGPKDHQGTGGSLNTSEDHGNSLFLPGDYVSLDGVLALVGAAALRR